MVITFLQPLPSCPLGPMAMVSRAAFLALLLLALSHPALAGDDDPDLGTLDDTVVRIHNPLGDDAIRLFDEMPDAAAIAEEQRTLMQRDLLRIRTLIMDQIMRTPGLEPDPVYDRPLLPPS